jgi:hypothetical protein
VAGLRDRVIEITHMTTVLLCLSGVSSLCALGLFAVLVSLAFRTSLVSGVLCLFVPLYVFYFGFRGADDPRARRWSWMWAACGIASALLLIVSRQVN